MRILAFDTATSATAVALSDGRGILERRDDPPWGERPRHATRLLPLVAELLAEAKLGWEQIDRIAVGLGPGTFTGLRIGVATAKGLAQASGIPLVGVSTLRALAHNPQLMPAPDSDSVVAVLDARRGEVYAAVWERACLDDDQAAPLLAPAALKPDALAGSAGSGSSRPLAIGDGAIAFREALERGGLNVPDDGSELHRVTAASHCMLARRLPVIQPDSLVPDYQRLPDAQPRDTQSAGSRRIHER